MNKSIYIPAAFMAACLIALAFVSMKKMDPLDWSPSFSRLDDRPYGSQIVFDHLGDIFDADKVYTSDLSTYGLFIDSLFWSPTAYVVINQQYRPDEYDTRELIDFVELGNVAFLAAENFSDFLKDSLKISTRIQWNNGRLDMPDDSNQANFVLPDLKSEKPFRFFWTNLQGYFDSYNYLDSEVLATNSLGQPILLKVKRGNGAFILCSTPFALTNYHMLYKHHHEFISTALSFIPEEHTIFWDEYYKVENLNRLALEGKTGKLSFIFSQESLTWAWLIFLYSLIFFVAFEVKRKQRKIPIVKPLPNLTLDFTDTIGRLYFQSQNHKNIAEKKINVLLEYIRSRYFMHTDDLSPAFVETLSAKSEVPTGHIQAICGMIGRVHRQDSITEDTLIELHTLIEEFYAMSAR